ncbi:hypothetical protein ACTFIT_003107 [Dictyostelium discoideum]
MATVIEAIRISNNLMDMDQLNKRPTFSRTIHNTNNNLTRILERRLDRIYLNNSLINYSQLYLRNLIPPKINDIPLSDHNFLSTTFTLPNIQMNKRRWRLKKSSILSSIMLKKIDFLLNDYSRELSSNHNSISFSQLNSLLNKIKQLYTEFQKQNDYNNKANIKNLISLLETEFKDQAFATLSAINESKKREEQLKQELNNYCEETSLKYISARIKKRHNDFTINAVKDAQGRTINKQELIEEEYVKYYSNLYDYKEDDPLSHYEMLENWTVTRDSTWDNLENEFTSQEILEVIKQLNPHKSPGPDGIPNLFYITHKEKLAPILASAFNDTLRNPHLISKNYKEGLIITIPKKGDPELIKNRRPITLANCIYKIHSKLINNRIIPILTKVINHNQKGFVPGRFIIDNIISMNELINYCNDKRINGIITLYDFEKAFDSISHGSILRSLQHINIPTNIINLIMNLLTKSEARIEINGRTTIPFEIKRGVKQGDPLSPTLFVLVIEALARKILQDDRITGLPLNNSNHREKFQSFADDSASMVPDSQQLELVLQHFNSFCKATSSKLNIDKSSSILIGNPDNTNQRIPISTNPERYLGYFFTGKGITRKMPEILNTIRSSLVLWKTTDSTIKTKTNILKAFALSKLTYYSYVENFKEEELNQINKLVEWFLSAPNNKNASGFQVINLMRTKRARYPLKVGGWNIWNIELRQLAQKLWIINQFILALETKQTNSSHHKSWEYQIQKNKFTSRYLKENLDEWNKIRIKKAIFNNNLTSIKNENGQPLSLAEWYTTIQDQNPTIPKTEFQSSLNLRGYSYNQLFNNILKIKDPKTRDTMFRFHARCLPINYLHNKQCPLCKEDMSKDPYGHLFFSCKKTKQFIKINKLKNFIYITTGKGKNWHHTRIRQNNNFINRITPKLSPTAKKDQEVNADYANHRFHKEYFEWNYKAIDYDLTRSFAYRNLMALILHNIWIWICNQIYSEDPLTDESLSYSSLLKKWHKLATLEYIKKAKDLKNLSAKDHNNFKDPKILLTSTIKLRKTTANYYCIPESSLPNIISFDQFI